MPPTPIFNPRSELFRVTSLTEENCYPIMQWAMPIIAQEEYPGFDGIGVVIVAGGKYLKYAFGAVTKLRQLDPDIPVQIWHLPGENISGQTRFDRFGNVTFHDIGPVWNHECSWVRTGWSAKMFAVKACSFRHVHVIDADCIPLHPPMRYFDSEEYGTTGMILFPDILDHNKGALWPCVGLKYKSVPEHESGQQFIDKKRAWEAIKLGCWMGSHHLFHDMALGDKNLFGLACAKLGIPFFTAPASINEPWGITQNWIDGKPAFMHVMHPKRSAAIAPKEVQRLWNSYEA